MRCISQKTSGRGVRGSPIAQVSLQAESPIAQTKVSQGMTNGKNRGIRYAAVWDMANIEEADRQARKGKARHYGVRKWDKHREENLKELQEALKMRTYRTSEPIMEQRVCEHKMRCLSKVHYRDHVAHHALMNVIMPVLERSYYYESAASIKGRGIHYTVKHVRRWIDMHNGRELWWTQVDFVKFYHHVKRQKIYDRLCRTFADDGIRAMLKDVIWALGNHNGLTKSDGTEGMGIGLYPVQPLVNYYLNDFDRAVSRLKDVKMFRYCDNVLLIGYSAKALWDAVEFIKSYARDVLEQPLHENIGIQKLDEQHPVDYAGYVFHRDYTFVRKRLKYTFKRKYKKTEGERRRQVLSSYKGWLEHADGLTLWKKVTGMKRFSELNISHTVETEDGKRYFEVPMIQASFLVGRKMVVKDFVENVETRNGAGRMCILVEENGSEKKFLTNNQKLKDVMMQVREMGELPFQAKLMSRSLSGGKIDYYFE